jgi:hypothetical protein
MERKMLISEDILELALAWIFDGNDPGSRLEYPDIANAWQRSGLRLADLRDAIREALDRRDLSAQHHHGTLAFELTPTGSRRFNKCRANGLGSNPWISSGLNADKMSLPANSGYREVA